MSSANCPKPECGGAALVSDGSYAGAFRVLHEGLPMAMPRSQRREVQKLLRKMIAGRITPEEALEDGALSSETKSLLRALGTVGVNVVTLILLLFTYLQAQAHQDEDRIDQANANETQRQFLETLAQNLQHLHENDAVLASRLRRAGAAQIVEIEQEQEATRPRPRAESAASPKPRSPKPQPTRKKKKGKKRA